jgi:uncharacterized protein (DUF1015 family)
MATIRPFRALRFGPDAATTLAQLISPPGAGRRYPRTGLGGLHPYNVLRLVRGRFDPLNTADQPPYDGTRRLMESWKQQGVLIRDPAPAMYLMEQAFTLSGQPMVRRGLVTLVHLEPLGRRNIFPHERTLRGPKPDIIDQLRALQASLSLTLGLVDDPDGELQRLLRTLPESTPLIDVVDGQGVRNRVAALRDDGHLKALTLRMAGSSIVIADGHHRYESALTYQREIRRSVSLRGAHPADYAMMLLVPTEDAGRSLLPPHRVLRGLPAAWRDRFDRELGRHFALQPMSDLAALEAFLARGTRPRYGAVTHDAMLGLTLRRSQRVQRVLDREPAAWRSLEIGAVRAVLLREVLGVSPDEYSGKAHSLYPTDAAEVAEAVHEEGYQLGILARPTPATQVTAIARSGQVMPPKSTNFFPKPAKGLVMNSLKGF